MPTSRTAEPEPCPCGGGLLEPRFVEVRFGLREPPLVLADVPQGACPACGSRVYRAEVLDRIEQTYRAASADREASAVAPVSPAPQ